YQDFGYPVDFVHAATMSIILLVVSILLTVFTNWYVGKSTHPMVVGKSRGSAKIILSRGANIGLILWSSVTMVLILIIPGIILLLGSISNTGSYTLSFDSLGMESYKALFELGQTMLALFNSAVFGLVATLTVLVLSLGLVYFERHGFRCGKLMNSVSDLSFVIPGIVLSFGLITAYSTGPLVLYNTAAIIVIAYIGRFLPFG